MIELWNRPKFVVLGAGTELLKQKLDRVRSYLIKTYLSLGIEMDDHQAAVRIMDAAKRNVDRAFIVATSRADDPARLAAEMELGLPRPDQGEIFRWRAVNHGIGRLGCPGCEYDYREGNWLPVKEIKSRLCPACAKGIQHSLGVESFQEVVEGVFGFRMALGLSTEQKTDVEALALQEPAILYCCEACGAWELSCL